MSNAEHPMTLKARREFVASLQEETPVRWLMLNYPKLRGVQDAIMRLQSYISKYPDLASQYNAEVVYEKEMTCERQSVLQAKSKEDALAFLSRWYNRPRAEVLPRYQAIMETVQGMAPEKLEAERDMLSGLVLSEQGETLEELTEAMASSEEPEMLTGGEYAELAVANLQRRIAEIEQERALLQDELLGQTGKCRELAERMDAIRQEVETIDKFMEIYNEEET